MKLVVVKKPETQQEREDMIKFIARTRGACLYETPKYSLPWHPTTKFRVDKERT